MHIPWKLFAKFLKWIVYFTPHRVEYITIFAFQMKRHREISDLSKVPQLGSDSLDLNLDSLILESHALSNELYYHFSYDYCLFGLFLMQMIYFSYSLFFVLFL